MGTIIYQGMNVFAEVQRNMNLKWQNPSNKGNVENVQRTQTISIDSLRSNSGCLWTNKASKIRFTRGENCKWWKWICIHLALISWSCSLIDQSDSWWNICYGRWLNKKVSCKTCEFSKTVFLSQPPSWCTDFCYFTYITDLTWKSNLKPLSCNSDQNLREQIILFQVALRWTNSSRVKTHHVFVCLFLLPFLFLAEKSWSLFSITSVSFSERLNRVLHAILSYL